MEVSVDAAVKIMGYPLSSSDAFMYCSFGLTQTQSWMDFMTTRPQRLV